MHGIADEYRYLSDYWHVEAAARARRAGKSAKIRLSVLTSNAPLISGPACPMYSVDAESNNSSVGSLATVTVCEWAHRSNSRTPSLVTLRPIRLYFRALQGAENVASTLDDDEYLLTSVYRRLTFIADVEVGATCTPSCTTCSAPSAKEFSMSINNEIKKKCTSIVT